MSARLSTMGALAALASMVAAPMLAHANGAFPSAGQILPSPTDPTQLWVRTDFGIAVSHDTGASWRILCHEAMHYSAIQLPSLAVTSSGKLLLALPDGLQVGAPDECSFAPVRVLDGLAVGDVSQNPGGTSIVFATPSVGRSQVFVSNDDAVTFTPVAQDLPIKFQPLTIDTAPSNVSHIYLSGLSGNVASPDGSFLRSFDGGATFDEILIPGSDLETAPFIAAVDPLDDLRVYLRLNGAPGKLLVTDDGGDTWNEIFTGTGFLRAFALSPDGSKAYVGGEADGVLRASVPTYDFQQVSATGAKCLKATAEGNLYACGNEIQQGYSAAISHDDGATFGPLLQLKCILGVYPCDAGTPVGDQCPPTWPLLMQELGTTDCNASGGGAGATASTTVATGASGTSGHAGSTGTGSGAGGSGGSGAQKPGSGCGSCAVGSGEGAQALAWAIVMVLVMGMAMTRRRRRRCSTSRRCRER